MIAIVTSSPRELQFLTALCEQRTWPSQGCESVDKFNQLVEQVRPRTVLTRTQLSDGYSDDILARKKLRPEQNVPTIVLAPADFSPKMEARQVDLGADCVMRDPVRVDVLVAFIRKFYEQRSNHPTLPSPAGYQFAGAEIHPNERRVIRRGKSIQVTRQEIAFIRLLHHSAGKLVTYATVYDELFYRRFEGDTANARVLFARTAACFARVGVALRDHVEVVSKSGYLYRRQDEAKQPEKPRQRKR